MATKRRLGFVREGLTKPSHPLCSAHRRKKPVSESTKQERGAVGLPSSVPSVRSKCVPRRIAPGVLASPVKNPFGLQINRSWPIKNSLPQATPGIRKVSHTRTRLCRIKQILSAAVAVVATGWRLALE